MALYHLQQQQEYEVQHIITTVNSHYDRVTMHGLRKELLIKQIEAISIPHSVISLPEQPSMEEYESLLGSTMSDLKAKGFTHAAFGDIFLEDLKEYRDNQLANLGLLSTYPLWKKDTKALIKEFISLGFKAVVVAANAELLDSSFSGRVIDETFIEDLPNNVDPCGENGEFHTFCFDGPIFERSIHFEVGETITRSYPSPSESNKSVDFWFCDLK